MKGAYMRVTCASFFIPFLLGALILEANSQEPLSQPQPDCGPRCLAMLIQNLGVETTLEEVVCLSGMEPNGNTTFHDLARAAQRKGLAYSGRRLSVDELKSLRVSAILHDPIREHFVVYRKYTSEGFHIWEPRSGNSVIAESDLEQAWSGAVLLVYKPEETVGVTGAPNILFDKYLEHCGVMGRDEFVDIIFSFRNAGQEPLRILDVKASCKCLATTKGPETILPGEKGQIGVRFASGRVEGTQRQNVVVESNDPDEPYVNLKIVAEVVPEYVTRPEEISFGVLPAGTTAIGRVLVSLSSGCSVTHAAASHPELATAIFPDGIVNGYPRFEVIIVLEPTAAPGVLRDKLVLQTDCPEVATILVPIRGRIQSEFTLTPKVFFFGEVKPGTWTSRDLRLCRRVNKLGEIRVSQLETGDSRLRAHVHSETIHPGKDIIIHCDFKADNACGIVKSWIDIHMEGAPKIRVPVFAECVEAGHSPEAKPET